MDVPQTDDRKTDDLETDDPETEGRDGHPRDGWHRRVAQTECMAQAILSVWLVIAVVCVVWWSSGSGDRQICDLQVNDGFCVA